MTLLAGWPIVQNLGRIESLAAEIDLRSLFGGVLRFDKLNVAKPTIMIERDAAQIVYRLDAYPSASGDNPEF
jgi:hypothetical protein